MTTQKELGEIKCAQVRQFQDQAKQPCLVIPGSGSPTIHVRSIEMTGLMLTGVDMDGASFEVLPAQVRVVTPAATINF